VRELTEKFRGIIPQNIRRKEPKHPDFSGTLVIWGTTFSVGAWLNTKADGQDYIALQFSNNAATQSEKLRFVLWKNEERSSENDPLFRSTQAAYNQEFVLRAWISQHEGSHALALAIEPALPNTGVKSPAVQETNNKIANLLADLAALPQTPETARLPSASKETEPDDIPF
jgi:uncharacterized protein (DUF736 family)